ncbi:ATP-binding protein [Bradyrhizobium vignae]|uniref:AAA family ATPase n=1 Tax=Bradyrhizobium vignae TaxID=1549949 RepID=A0ABS4A598_9BRAD|nr:AAA family ATPase [Bradyrhizobium vignae]
MPDFISFRSLKISNWQQFASIDINFHPTLTVITGANGAGKTTILNLLSRHLGAARPHFSIPRRNEFGADTYVTGRLGGLWMRIPT